MKENLQVNADRFMGFADIYDAARPKCPDKVLKILLTYLKRNPSCVVDLGCGTGLSTILWHEISQKVIGVEPSSDMREKAKEKSAGIENIEFISAFSDNTGLDNHCADIVTCSQSFHWMNPEKTLEEVARILKDGGIFATYDCDWPPVCDWQAELEYQKLFEKVKEIESKNQTLQESFIRWDKNRHLFNIKNSGKFRYVREIVFSNSENCDAKRLISLALSQGGLQAIIKTEQNAIAASLDAFKNKIIDIWGDAAFEIDFCYRMRIGIK